jgi:hypothetical protein
LHTVGKVHGYFFYIQAFQGGQFLEHIDNNFYFVPLLSLQCTLTAMSLFV